MILSLNEVEEIVSQAGEKDLPAWEEDFIADLAERLAKNLGTDKVLKLTARQEEQLIRIQEQFLMTKKKTEKPAAKGHNKPPKIAGINSEQLAGVIERVEKLEEERSAVVADIREVLAEAKGNGYDVKAIRKILKLRKKDAAERAEEEALLDTYLRALGMLPELD